MTGQVKGPRLSLYAAGQDESLPEAPAARTGLWLRTLESATSSKKDGPAT